MANDNRSPETRSSLIQRVSQRDPESWNEFITLYDPLLLAYVRDCNRRFQVGLSEADCEDVKQEVLIKLFLKLPSFDPGRRFRTWLWQVTRNAVIDWVRCQAGRRTQPKGERPRPRTVHLSTDQQDFLAKDDCPPDEQLIQNHNRHMLDHILEKVKAEMQSAHKWDCFKRHFLDWEASVQVAKELGLSVAAVNTYTSRVLARVRELCQYYEVDP
jgi:RNA polymerase sigma-70 factor (ECF subfamily)